MRGFVIVLFLLLSGAGLYAQVPAQTGKYNNDVFDLVASRRLGDGQVNILQTPEMKELVNTHVAMNERLGGVEGFRVQLYSGSGSHAKQEALEIKSKVLSLLSPPQIYVEYNAPFWRVRVGSFRHKHEALPLLHQLKSGFPNCYVVKAHDIKLDTLP
jgi:hypothetical protein